MDITPLAPLPGCPAVAVTLVNAPTWVTLRQSAGGPVAPAGFTGGTPHIRFEVPYTVAACTTYNFKILRDGNAKKATDGSALDENIELEVRAPC